MSAPNEHRPGRPSRRRRWATGAAVTLAVLAVALVVLALLPRTASATASLTVTPRTDAGADAARLLADRYTALAGSEETLEAARAAAPALADVPLAELVEGTAVEHAGGTATISVRVTLADRETAVAAANAVVDTLVETGAGEDLVDVGRGAEATAARADTAPDRPRWTLVALPLALVCGLVAAAPAGRRPASAPAGPPPPSPAAAPTTEVVDDLPGFLENPPGSAPALPPVAAVRAPVATPPSGATAVPAAASPDRPAESAGVLSRRGAAVATATAVVVLVVVSGLVAATTGESAGRADRPAAATPTSAAPTSAVPTTAVPTTAVPTTAVPIPATDTAAAALAFESVPLGEDGLAARVTFTDVLLEQRAVGVTVTEPDLSVSTDGRHSLAHVRLPTFNCLTAEPPADPLAAGCVRSLTEYADLAAPQLQVSRDGDRLDVAGLFPTYVRSNGSPPAYTGRAYQLTATITADGPAVDGRAPAAGTVRIGLDDAPTTVDPGVNLLLFPR